MLVLLFFIQSFSVFYDNFFFLVFRGDFCLYSGMVEAMKIRSHYDGLDIRVVVVRPVEEPAAVLQIAHGMCGSKERYMPFMEFMSRNGIACIIHDHRGHGDSVKSDKDLGYMYEGGADALVDDMRLVEMAYGSR